MRFLLAALPAALVCVLAAPALAQAGGAYTDPKYLTGVPFGSSSPWLQAWRGYSETRPASFFLGGLGIVMDAAPEANDEALCRHLQRAGICQGRVEIGWSSIEWDGSLSSATRERMARLLQAMRRHGIRPLILLNAHHGAPGPTRFFGRKLAAAARKGDTAVQLDDVSDLAIGHSGLRNLSGYIASEAIVTKVEGRTVTLSQPLPKDLGSAGAQVEMSTLKFRPFGPPNSEDYKATRAGWQDYTRAVCNFVRQTMAQATPAPSPGDAGFDVEAWNELSFGSNFLTINSYYKPKLADYDEDKVWADVLLATAQVLEERPRDFAGVRLCDGFSNTIPWPASSQLPPRVSAMSKHPYAGLREYPRQKPDGEIINALGQPEKAGGFYPSFTASFPEYYATWLQTESLMRETAPITTEIYNTKHGRLARIVKDRPLPVWPWMTEMGWAPEENGIADRKRGLDLKAKTLARTWLFYNSKGVQRVYPYAANARDLWLGVVRDDFLELSKKEPQRVAAPGFDDSKYFSPALLALSRIVGKMREGLDPKLAPNKVRNVELIKVIGGGKQWSGDGTPAHPDLMNRDVFVWLPYQVSARKWIVPFYVMTRDVRQDLAPETFELQIHGVNARAADFSVYDPRADTTRKGIAPQPRGNAPGDAFVGVEATDFPRLLIIQQ